MRFCLFLFVFLLSCTLSANSLTPCEIVGFDEVAEEAIPYPDTGVSDQDIEKEKALLIKCIKKYAVCIVEASPKSLTWLNRQLVEPVNNKYVDPLDGDLVFGLLQYTDKKTGKKVCMVTQNTLTHAVPWMGSSWVTDGKIIKKYKFWDDLFNMSMTPKSLYNALLRSHEEAVRDDRCVKSYPVINSN